MPPPLPAGGTMPPQTHRLGAPAALVLTYQGRPYTVDKDRYLLGRSKTQADLRLDDANVSRQHAMIERVGNAWYVVDLGSTNGVYVDGERVARRAVRDGDVIEITTHRIECRLR
jgi:pSer/pThr/pTyr-binding forkhead associated (FHA) protein